MGDLEQGKKIRENVEARRSRENAFPPQKHFRHGAFKTSMHNHKINTCVLFTYQVPLLGEFGICGFHVNVSLASPLGNLLLCPKHLKITHRLEGDISYITHPRPCDSSLFSPLTKDVRPFHTIRPHSKNTLISTLTSTVLFNLLCFIAFH